MELIKYSRLYTQNDDLPAALAMLYGAGLTENDRTKAQIGIGTTGYEGNTCNMHLQELGNHIKTGVVKNNLVGWRFDTIGVSDGITNGSPTMQYSLVSREVIADSDRNKSRRALLRWFDNFMAGCTTKTCKELWWQWHA